MFQFPIPPNSKVITAAHMDRDQLWMWLPFITKRRKNPIAVVLEILLGLPIAVEDDVLMSPGFFEWEDLEGELTFSYSDRREFVIVFGMAKVLEIDRIPVRVVGGVW